MKKFEFPLLNTILFLSSVLVLLVPALQNGFPLFYSDSATYIVSGFDRQVPISRPILYCLIVRHVSLSYSLWFVLVFQAAIMVGLMWLTLKNFINSRWTGFYSYVLCAFLGFFTGLSNYLSQIMPDVFTGFMIWAFTLLFLVRPKITRRLLIVVIVISATVHFSNLLIITGLSALAMIVVLLLRKYFEDIKTQLIQLSLISILPWLLIPSINYLFDGEFYLNKSSNTFFTGRLIETGILKDFFETETESKKYSLYAEKNRLPEKAWQFLWNDDSPLYDGNCSQDGGWSNCWKVRSDEYGKMIKDVLTTPRLLGKFIRISMVDWGKQLLDFNTGHLTPQGKGSAFDEIVPRYFDDSELYRRSNQYHETLVFDRESKIQQWTIGISLLALILMLVFLIHIGYENMKKIWILLTVIVIGLLVNAFFCSVFSGVLNRYQGRVIWLIPMVMGILALVLIQPLLNNIKRAIPSTRDGRVPCPPKGLSGGHLAIKKQTHEKFF